MLTKLHFRIWISIIVPFVQKLRAASLIEHGGDDNKPRMNLQESFRWGSPAGDAKDRLEVVGNGQRRWLSVCRERAGGGSEGEDTGRRRRNRRKYKKPKEPKIVVHHQQLYYCDSGCYYHHPLGFDHRGWGAKRLPLHIKFVELNKIDFAIYWWFLNLAL